MSFVLLSTSSLWPYRFEGVGEDESHSVCGVGEWAFRDIDGLIVLPIMQPVFLRIHWSSNVTVIDLAALIRRPASRSEDCFLFVGAHR